MQAELKKYKNKNNKNITFNKMYKDHVKKYKMYKDHVKDWPVQERSLSITWAKFTHGKLRLPKNKILKWFNFIRKGPWGSIKYYS